MIQLAVFATVVAFQGSGGRAPLPARATLPTDTVALGIRAGDAERAFLAKWYAAWRASQSKPPAATPAPVQVGTAGTPVKPLLGTTPVWNTPPDPRIADLSCNPPRPGSMGIRVPDLAWGVDPALRRIESGNGKLGVCPNWMSPSDSGSTMDERARIDNALMPEVRSTITQLRSTLIALFDTAVMAMPNNATLTGQRVRLLVDQGELGRAEKAARECKAIDWWCSALAGFVFTQQRNLRAADSAHVASAAWLIDSDRCTWTDVSTLLDSAGRATYNAMACSARLAFNEQFWWLSDPLWSVPGNDRRAEHFSRQVTATLHAASGRDERYHWAPEHGGDALTQVVMRYGWPSYTHYGLGAAPGTNVIPRDQTMANPNAAMASAPPSGGGSGRGGGGIGPSGTIVVGPSPVIPTGRMLGFMAPGTQAAYMMAGLPAGGPSASGRNVTIESFYTNIQENFGKDFPIGPLYLGDVARTDADYRAPTLGSTFEYSIGRVHSVPQASALTNPFAAKASDWTLNAPRGDMFDVRAWWPAEHYQPRYPIVQLADYQSAFLRRDRNALFAFSTNLALTDLLRGPADSVSVNLLMSPGPQRIEMVSRRNVAIDRAVFLEAMNGPGVVSVEVPWDSAQKPAARTRFGATPPQSLSTMARGATAISDPILLVVPVDGHALPVDADDAIDLMLGQTSLALGTSRIGVYWETYGFFANDTIEVSLRVQRSTPLTLAERAGVATGLGADANTPVTMSWREPDPGRTTRTVAGAMPIQMRSVIVDISALRDGDYVLEISVGKPGTSPVRSQRSFVVR